ncbi:LemA family protein [Pleionea litopenaei]|uniref:LemA family protein n=1 Tax=Pleionea litopenaei TaxID=3070815 RepID=A0AA51X5F7_9GAMM|nr:LemA family protein [Pleionea sp. HL-JVS1]WMS85541.1 LemA family protein [Pleionea sp. HL-JVS1]
MEWIILAVVAVIIFYVIGIYNKLVSLRNRFKNAFSQIDVQLTRRYDLIPNLVETAKAYMSHERETLEAVIAARSQAVSANQKAADDPSDAGSIQALMGAESVLTGAMGRLFAVMESYPDLKANETMSNVMEELTTTENKIAFARQAFNDSVMFYNTYREQFPNNIVANNFSFQEAQLFEVEEPEARKAVKVNFS